MARILLVEDSPTQAAFVGGLLESDGHNVIQKPDGAQAMESLHEEQPDVIVTDLMMPNVNGCELTRKIVADHPRIPVVVITAHGAEGLAVDALADGAVNFVPKSLLEARLGLVVSELWQRIQVDRQASDSGAQLFVPELVFEIESDVRAVWPVASCVQQMLAFTDAIDVVSRYRFTTAVASAMVNAICYGNLEYRSNEESVIRHMRGQLDAPKVEHCVKLVLSVGVKDARAMISHDGPGTMTRTTPAPGTPESFDLEDCRGLMLITSFMDQVIFNQTRNEVVMVKNR